MILNIVNLRDLLDFKKLNKPIDIKEVEALKLLEKDLVAEACHIFFQQKHMKLWLHRNEQNWSCFL